MLKGKMKLVLSVLLAFVFMLAAGACGGSDTPDNTGGGEGGGASGGGTSTQSDFTLHVMTNGVLGDCMLIQSGGKNVLIDGGERNKTTAFIDYMNALGVERLDYIFLTHPHEDHVGGMAAIVNEYEVGAAYAKEPDWTLLQEIETKDGLPEQYYDDFENALAAKGVTITQPTEEGERIRITKDLYISIYNLANFSLGNFGSHIKEQDLNTLGLVYLAEYKGKKIAFPGDTYCEGDTTGKAPGSEAAYEAIGDVDVLLAAHHGGTGYINSYHMLDVMKPETVICSFPSVNGDMQTGSYYLLNVPTITRCTEYGIPIYSTGQSGHIVVHISADGTIELNSTREGKNMTVMTPPADA